MHASAHYPGGEVEKKDINDIIGSPSGSPANTNKVLQPFIDDAEAKNSLAAIYGVGYGDRGYGQSAVNLSLANAEDTVLGTLWENVISAIKTCANHQGTPLSMLPDSIGEIIEAFNSSHPKDMGNYDIDAVVALIDDNRNECSSEDMMTISTYTDTRSNSWGSGSSSINSEFRVTFDDETFGDENHARYFFNTGGAIVIKLSHNTGAPTAQDTSWNNLLSNTDRNQPFQMTFVSSSITTNNNSPDITTGYYGLTESYVTIYSDTSSDSPYTSNTVEITAMGTNEGNSNENGGKGKILQFNITLSDLYTGVVDGVSPNTKLTVDIRRCNGGASTIDIPAPSITSVSSFND